MAVFTQEQLDGWNKEELRQSIQILLEDIRIVGEGIVENCEEIDEILTRLTRMK